MKTLLPYFKKTTSLLILMLFMAFVQKSFGQTTASETWALTSNNNAGTPVGNITASSASSGTGITASNSTSDGLNAVGWSTNNTLGTSDYFQYSLSPTSGNILTVSTMSFIQTTNTSGTVKYVVNYYVTSAALPNDGTFYSSSTNIYSGTVTNGTDGNTITINSLNISVPSGSTIYVRVYAYDVVNGSSTTFGNRTVKISGTTAVNTSITTSAITTSTYCVTPTATAAISIPFTSVGTYTSNTYTAQLSDASGSFTTPVSLGTLTSNSNSGTISGTIPANTATGAGYKVRVISSNPAVTGSNSATTLTINLAANSIAPTATQNINTSTTGATLTVTEQSTTSTRQWYYGSVSTGPYNTAIGTANSTTYIPSFSTAGTYFVVCKSTYSCGVATSNSVQITVVTPAITTSAISGSPFCVTSSVSASVSVPFTSVGTFSTGNTYTAQLLSSTGTVLNNNIGQITSTSNSGIISATIPKGTATNNYQIRIVSSNPIVNGSAVSISVNDYSVNITPAANQSYAAGGTGNVLTVTEPLAAASRTWYYATQSGGPYTSLAATGTTYTPSNINSNVAGTYYVACISTFGTCAVKDTSNEVQVTVTPGALANITTNPTTLPNQRVGAYFPSITVTGKDAYGNLVNGGGLTIAYSVGPFITPTTATLSSTGTVTLTNIEVSKEGNSVTLTFASAANSAIKATISGFSVSAFASSTTDNFKTNNTGSTSPGEWATAGNWMSSHDAGNSWYTATSAPTNTAGSIAVLGGYTVTVTSSFVSGESIAIGSGGEIDVNSSGTLTIKDGSANALVNAGIVKVNSGGALVNQGTISNTGSVSINANGTYNHATNSGSIPTATWDVASTCIVSGVTSTAPSGLGQAFGNFTWNSSQTSDINLNSALTTVNGIFTYSSSGSSDNLILAHNSSLTLNIGSNFVFNSGATLVLTDGSSNPTINVVGSVTLSAGATIDFGSSNNFGAGSGTIALKGDFSETGGTSRLQSGLFGSNGTIKFNGTNQHISSALTNGSNVSNVDFTIASGSTVSLLTNFTIANSAQFSFISGTLTVSNGAVLICGNNVVSGVAKNTNFFVQTNSTVSVASGGTIQIGSQYGITTSTSGTTGGNIQTATRTFDAAGIYVYNNGTATQFTGNGLPTSISGSLTINNASGVTLSQATTLSGKLNLTAGVLTTSASSLLSLTSAVTINMPVSDYTTTSYIDGPLQRTGSAAFVFPIGKSGIGYVPIGISATSNNSSQTFTAEYKHTSPQAISNTFANGSSLKRISNCDYWMLNYGTANTSYNSLPAGVKVGVTLYWNPNNSCDVVNNLASLAIAHYDGTSWDAVGLNTYSTGASTTNSFITCASVVSSFSPFTLGTIDGSTNPLPITLDYFTATKQVGYNKLTWKVECSSSSSSFDVERSYDGISFEAINTVKVSSATDCALPFVYNDYNSNGSKVYYRIKMVDIDDNAKYSNIELISNDANAIELMNIQPNPVYGDASLKISASAVQNIELAIIGIDGKQMQHKTIQVQQGTNNVQLNTGALAKGIYFVKGIFANGQTNVIKFIKQ